MKTASAPFREASLIAGGGNTWDKISCAKFLTKERWGVEMQWFPLFNYLSCIWLLTLHTEAAEFRRLEVVNSVLKNCSFHFKTQEVLLLGQGIKNSGFLWE